MHSPIYGGISARRFAPVLLTVIAIFATSAAPASAESIKFLWETRMAGKPAGPISLSESRLTVASTRSRLHQYDTQTGERILKKRVGVVVHTAVLSSDRYFYMGAGAPENRVLAFPRQKGIEGWSVRLRDVLPGSILTDKALIYATGDGTLISLQPDSGTTNWSFASGARYSAGPLFHDGTIYIGTDKGDLIAVDSDSGAENWRAKGSGAIMGQPVLVDHDVLIVRHSGLAQRYDRATGEERSQYDLNEAVWAAPVIGDGHAYFVTTSGKLLSLDLELNRLVWSADSRESFAASPVLVGDFVVAGTKGGLVLALATSDGSVIAERRLGGGVSVSPVADGNRFYIASDDGFITAFGIANDTGTNAQR